MKDSGSSTSIITKFKNSWMPARPSAPVIIVVFALIGFAVFYYLDFSSREANLVRRAFLHLNLIGDQIALQTNNYYKAIASAPPDINEQYVATFLPGVQYSYENAKNYQENTIISEDDNYYLFLKVLPKNGKPLFLKAPISALLKERQSTAIGADIFNDVLLADKEGRIIFQLNQSGPRIIQMNTLIRSPQGVTVRRDEESKQPLDEKALSNQFAEQSTFSNLLDIQLAGAGHKLFFQPLFLRTSKSENRPDRPHYVLCGLVRSDQFFLESLRVPFGIITGIVFSTLLLALSLPLLKVIFLKPRERFTRNDAYRLFVLLPVIVALLSLAFVSSYHFVVKDETDSKLKRLADEISEKFASELSLMRGQLEALGQSESLRDPSKVQSASVPDALRVVTDYTSASAYPFFNSVFWMDTTGQHKVLWHVREKAPPLLNVGNRAYAKDLFEKRYSYISTGTQSEAPITLEPINSWITGENSLVSCIPHPIGGGGVVSKPLSLVKPFLPPGYGYAVVNNDGLVLFHNDEPKNLVENLFEESDMNRTLIAAVRNRSNNHLDTTYRGKDYRFYVASIPQISRLPWTLVVFREKTPPRLLYTKVIVECFLCFLVTYALACMLGYLVVRQQPAVRSSGAATWYLPNWLWPQAKRAPSYLLLSACFLVLGLLLALLLYKATLSVLLLSAILSPFISIAFYLHILKRGRRLRAFRLIDARHWRKAYLLSILSLLLVVSVLPCLAFFKIAFNYELNQMIRLEKLSLATFYADRAEQVMGAYRKINFPSDEKREEFLTARMKVSPDALDSYQDISFGLHSQEVASTFQCPEIKRSGVEVAVNKFLSLVSPSFDRFSPTSRGSKNYAPGGVDWRWCGEDGKDLLINHYRDNKRIHITSDVNSVQLASEPLWWLGGLLLMLIIYRLTGFISQKLFLPATDQYGEESSLPKADSGASNTLILCDRDARERLSVEKAYGSSALVINISEINDRGDLNREINKQGSSKHRIVVLDHFEFRMDDEEYNAKKLKLLEHLTLTEKKVVFIVSTVDPISYFNHNYLPESDDAHARKNNININRWAELLRSFSKWHYGGDAGERQKWSSFLREKVVQRTNPVSNGHRENFDVAALLEQECGSSYRLQQIGEEIAERNGIANASPEQLVDEVADRAEAYYRTLWNGYSMREKLLLIQLAQEGVTNPKCQILARELQRKGAIVRNPVIRIFNESFKRFVTTAEPPDRVRRWERENIKGGWGSKRIIFWGGLVGLIGFLLYTQREFLQSGLALVSAIIGIIAALLNVLDERQKRNKINTVERD